MPRTATEHQYGRDQQWGSLTWLNPPSLFPMVLVLLFWSLVFMSCKQRSWF